MLEEEGGRVEDAASEGASFDEEDENNEDDESSTEGDISPDGDVDMDLELALDSDADDGADGPDGQDEEGHLLLDDGTLLELDTFGAKGQAALRQGSLGGLEVECAQMANCGSHKNHGPPTEDGADDDELEEGDPNVEEERYGAADGEREDPGPNAAAGSERPVRNKGGKGTAPSKSKGHTLLPRLLEDLQLGPADEEYEPDAYDLVDADGLYPAERSNSPAQFTPTPTATPTASPRANA